MSHLAGLPDLFIDRSLGRKKVPAILRGAGLRLRTLAEVYGIPRQSASLEPSSQVLPELRSRVLVLAFSGAVEDAGFDKTAE